MNRRTLFKLLAALPLIGRIPAVRAWSHGANPVDIPVSNTRQMVIVGMRVYERDIPPEELKWLHEQKGYDTIGPRADG